MDNEIIVNRKFFKEFFDTKRETNPRALCDFAKECRISPSLLKKIIYCGQVPSSRIRLLISLITKIDENNFFPTAEKEKLSA